MKTLFAYLLGHPRVIADGEEIRFPFKQSEALLYYLLVERNVSRAKISDLIWGDTFDEQKVRSNMRNAIYVLRKTLGADFLIEPQKNMLCINPEIELRLDLDILREKHIEDFSFYRGSFLEDFYLKNSEYYNEWILSCQQNYNKIYQQRLREQIEKTFSDRSFDRCEEMCARLIEQDEFDEFGYRYLLEIYQSRGDYSAALSLFGKLKQLLSDELFQVPSDEIVSLVEDIKKEQNKKIQEILFQEGSVLDKEEQDTPFYGRTDELAQITDAIDDFVHGRRSCSLGATGEVGIGKTRLFSHALSRVRLGDEVMICRTQCYHAEENYILKPWQSIFEQIVRDAEKERLWEQGASLQMAVSHIFPYFQDSTASAIDQDDIATERYDSNLQAISYHLMQIAQKRRLILCFDDLQWADRMTISLLRNILTSDRNQHILVLFACREERRQYIDSMIEDMRHNGLLRLLPLKRFDFDNTVALARSMLPGKFDSDSLQQQLYKETEGNPFFVIETVNNIKYNGNLADITPNMRDMIRLRTITLPKDARNVLDLLSLFFDGATADILRELSNKDDYELMSALDVLLSKRLIREEAAPDAIQFQFTHQKILEYVYSEMSLTKRTVLHGKIGECLESKLHHDSRDVQLFPKLMYHFNCAGNQKKYVAYYIEYIYNYLNRSHEYYPVLSGIQPNQPWGDDQDKSSDDRESITRTLYDLQDRLEAHMDSLTDEDYHTFYSDFCHMMGRYHIRKVEYDEGYPYIMRLIELNRGIDTKQCRNNLIKAYRQLICIYIDRYETQKMHEVIERAFAVLRDSKSEELATWMRLDGLYRIMVGQSERGVLSLRTAVDIFENSREKKAYLFNLAACYAWLGEAERHAMHFTDALEYYDLAIAICTENMLTGGVCTFYTYAGQASFDSGDMEKAGYYLRQAVEQFDRVELMWGRGIAFSYYALFCLRCGDYAQSRRLLERAEEYSQRLDSRYEKGVENRIFAQIRLEMEQNAPLRAAFDDYLTLNVYEYVEESKKLLEGVFSPIDRVYLERIEEMIARDIPAAEKEENA